MGQFETCVVGGDVHAHERGFSWIRCGTGRVFSRVSAEGNLTLTTVPWAPEIALIRGITARAV
ncbi:hypothetical protein GCM10009824_03310 [Kocuria atrinae]|uniref:Uncharacterized protein n=1 Tax=Kocuria atrinae TaxID=592377 RepID=A0ABN2XCZ8_9MICC